MDTVQLPLTSLRSTVPDGSKRSCPHASGEEQRRDNESEGSGGLHSCAACALTWLRGWNRGRDVLKDGAGLCWTWGSTAVRWLRRRVGVDPFLSAASQAAALDGDGLGHVHAQQRAERLWLGGTHARHGPGLDPISTGD